MFDSEVVDRGELTEREAEILRLLVNAQSEKDIARLLELSIKTVEHHIEHINAKLGVTHSRLNRRVMLVRSALARGLVRLLVVVMLVGAVDSNDDLARLGRTRLPTPRVTKTRRANEV